MDQCFLHSAFIGPGGPEFLLVMLVLIMLFGAKDAPRIMRKLNEIINQIRNAADGFKREVMYSDLTDERSSEEDAEPDETEVCGFDAEEDPVLGVEDAVNGEGDAEKA